MQTSPGLRHARRRHRNIHHQTYHLILKHAPMQARIPPRGTVAQPRRHRTHETPRDQRIRTKEHHFQPAQRKGHRLASQAVVDCRGAGGEGGWEGGGEVGDAGVEHAKMEGGDVDGEKGGL